MCSQDIHNGSSGACRGCDWQRHRVSTVGPQWPLREKWRQRLNVPDTDMHENQREASGRWTIAPSQHQKQPFKLHLACSNRCIYIAALEAPMCNKPASHRNLKQISLTSMEGWLKDFAGSLGLLYNLKYVVFCLRFFLPLSQITEADIQKERRKKYSPEMRFLTECPLTVTEWMQQLPGYAKVSKTRQNAITWAKLFVSELQLPHTLLTLFCYKKSALQICEDFECRCDPFLN